MNFDPILNTLVWFFMPFSLLFMNLFMQFEFFIFFANWIYIVLNIINTIYASWFHKLWEKLNGLVLHVNILHWAWWMV